MLWDSAGIVRFVNPAGLRLVGLTENLATNVTTTDQFTPGATSTVEDAEHTARAKRPWRGLGEVRRTGTDVPVPVVLSAFVVSRTTASHLVAALIRERPRHPRLDAELVDVDAADRLTTGQAALAGLARLGVSADLDAVSAATTTAATLLDVRSAAVARRGAPTDPLLRIDAVTGTLRTDVVVPVGDGSMSGHALAHRQLTVRQDVETESRFDRRELLRGRMEVAAESVAYVLAGILGLDTAAYSVGYVAGWADGNLDTVTDTARAVLATVHELADALDPHTDTDSGDTAAA